MLKHLLLIISIAYTLFGYTQSFQTVRGTIKESFSEKTIVGVKVKILNNGISIKETISNSEGQYNFENIELGTYDILFSHISYESFISPGVEVSISKEIVLDISMKFRSKILDAVELTPPKLRGEPINQMATTSSYSIQADDAKRIAGGLDDPIRVAGTLPGVTSSAGFSSNFISIRGNSPRSLKYQMDGIELPNPTHFSRIGSSGGTFTIFSLQLLDKSDFYTGAFSAEYGNALGGIFDANLRKGNPYKFEHTIKIGVLGIDVASEGPLSKKHKASYAFNYRYGYVGLPELFGYPTQPTYQDLSFTINWPISPRTSLKAFAIGGTSIRNRPGVADSLQWYEGDSTENNGLKRNNLVLKSSMGTAGLIFKHFLSENTVLKITGATSYTDQVDNKEYIMDDYSIIDQKTNHYTSTPTSFAASIKHQFSKSHFHTTGISFTNTFHRWAASKYDFTNLKMVDLVNGQGSSNQFKAYTASKLKLTKKLSLNIGLHALYYDINKELSIEPRANVSYKFNNKHEMSFSFGKHSQIENYATYFYQPSINNYPNNNLEFSKALHYILGYKGKVWVNHKLRVEVYYQNLYAVPASATGTFSTINISELQDLRTLTNNGTGENYGIDIGFERYTDNGLYYIINSSFYRSFYKSGDGIKRSSEYDNLYNIKFLIGKEYKLREKKGKYKAFAWNTNLATVGGQTYTPINFELSELYQETVLDESLAYSKRDNPLVYLDFTFSYKINKKNRRSVWSLQIKNIFSNGNAIYREYDTVTKKEVVVPSSGRFPILSYRLEF